MEAGEACEDGQLEGASCESLGYASGVLSCWDCAFDSSGCTFDEDCTDGADNDGDGDIDCGDADCGAACADPCALPRTIADPGLTTGSTTDQANRLDSSCSAGAGLSGAEAVFRFVPDLDGLLEARLTSSAAELTVSIRQGCEASASELACALGATASALVTAGAELFIVVDGASTTEAGPFILEVGTRELACSNALLDPGEQCEDGNAETGDGCDAACAVESSEGAANDVASAADALVIPYFGRISPANDVDWVAVEVPADGGAIYAATRGFLDEDCANGALDTYLELYASDGAQRLASNDDSGTSCAVLEATGLAAGTYLLRAFGVTENTPEFAYVLDVAVQ